MPQKALVEASRKEDGCLAYDLFESATIPEHLMICEAWRDRKALDSHSVSAHFAEYVGIVRSPCGNAPRQDGTSKTVTEEGTGDRKPAPGGRGDGPQGRRGPYEAFQERRTRTEAKFNESDVVTVADKEAERIIISGIRSRFPAHFILSEESGASHTGSRIRWIIDPLDGTTNFSQGLPLFSVSIAHRNRRRRCRRRGIRTEARRDVLRRERSGAFLNGERISCSSKTTLDKAVAATGFPVDKDSNPDNNPDNVARIIAET